MEIPEKNKISAIINTYNEECNIKYALESIKNWVDEIILVDMHSTDKTVEIAKKYKAKVYYHKKLQFVEPARKFALSKTTHNWILRLDADEIVTKELSNKLKEIVLEDKIDVVYIPSITYMSGVIIKHTGWGWDMHPRFFRKKYMHFTHQIHKAEKTDTNARVLYLRDKKNNSVIHFNYINFEQFIDKLNRYTNVEAEQLYNDKQMVNPLFIIIIPIKEFLLRYIYKLGILDGWRGLYLSSLMSIYRMSIYAKLYERKTVGTKEQIIKNYQKLKVDLVKKI